MTPRTTTARRGHAALPGRRRVSPAIPRRVSGPAPRPVAARVAVPAGPARTIPARPVRRGLIQRVMGMPDHPLVDRLLRGRMWICMIAVCLGGIVAMQVSLLKLNTGISRAVQTSATLERQNAGLASGIARLSSQERIRTAAIAQGMHAPEAGDIAHVQVRGPQDGRRAVKRMSEPSDQARAVLVSGAGGEELSTAGDAASTSTATAVAPVPSPPAPVAGTVAPVASAAPEAGATTAPQG
jgi:cell division protein FtsL